MTARVRFAPSPTGYLHVGAARAALFNYLYARKTGGKFLLRIEDTDLARSTDESTRSILEGLAWIGLDAGRRDRFPVRQRRQTPCGGQQAARRGQGLSRLHAQGRPDRRERKGRDQRTCPCRAGRRRTCGTTRIASFPRRKRPRAAGGEPFAIRLESSGDGKTTFDDGVFGLQERDYAETEDLVLLRSDGHPLYNLAVVCDDIEMRITDVIRGQDHLTNTHKQILIYEALGVTPPNFAHLAADTCPGRQESCQSAFTARSSV